MRGPRLSLAPAEWACVAFAVAVAHGFLLHEVWYPSAWDATQYLNMGREIAARGLWSPVEGSGMRPYAYPFLLSLVLRAARATGASFVALLFALQLLAYGAAVFLLRRMLEPVSPLAARIAFCGLLGNFFVLIYTPETLTESVSLTLLVLVAACWIRAWHAGLAGWPVAAGSLAAGVALVIRPANVYLAAAWAFGLALLWLRQRPSAGRTVGLSALAAIGFALPLAPQIAINATYHGRATPFVTADIGLLQQSLGVQYLKYATGLPPVPAPPVPYENPFLPGTTLDEAAPLRWYVDHPGRGLATIVFHTFNLTDQDLLFTYSRDLWPWYRVPVGIVNHAAVALGVVGLVLLGGRLRRAPDPKGRDALAALLALIVANWAVHAWTAVEMRFGSVILLVLFPFAVFAVSEGLAAPRRPAVAAVALATVLYVGAALALSGWIRDQAPQIRNAISAGSGTR
jgi:hypothetical protein